MSAAGWLWLTVVITGAMALTIHIVTLWAIAFRTQLAWSVRLLALVPPAAPWVGWLGGLRWLPVSWGLLVTLYAALWMSL